MLHPADVPQLSHVEQCLGGDAITVAATDYVRAYPSIIAPFVGGDFVALGTDGFGAVRPVPNYAVSSRLIGTRLR